MLHLVYAPMSNWWIGNQLSREKKRREKGSIEMGKGAKERQECVEAYYTNINQIIFSINDS